MRVITGCLLLTGNLLLSYCLAISLTQKIILSGMNDEGILNLFNDFLKKNSLKFLKIGGASLVAVFNFPNVLMPIFYYALLEIVFRTADRIKNKERTRLFNQQAYKIYRYLAIQLTAGIHSTEVLKSLHYSVECIELKNALKSLSGAYFRTMNFDLASKEFYKHYNNKEAETLLLIIQQGVIAGNAYEMVKTQEQIMVNKYFNTLEVNGQWLKVKGSMIAILLSLLIFILLAIPMLYEMTRATHSIFNG